MNICSHLVLSDFEACCSRFFSHPLSDSVITTIFLQDTHFALQQNDLVREFPKTP